MREFLKILLIEDLEMAQKVAINILSSMGHRVIVASCGERALNYIITHHIDLVLLDLDLPDMDGFSISEIIRGLERKDKHKIIIALTAHSTEDLPEKCRRFGIDDYIIKPLNEEKARYTLSKHCSLSRY